MYKKVEINNQSVETAGITKDYKKAIAEYIWNAFDAKASVVRLNCKKNGFGGVELLEIIDNGIGIEYENIDNTFGAFLSSEKRRRILGSSYVHGKKGKGRYSFITFAKSAKWETQYNIDKELFFYDIFIDSENKDHYMLGEKKKYNGSCTGTKVSFEGIDKLTANAFTCDEFKEFLSKTFGWFLYLNKDRNFDVYINDEKLDYNKIIDKDYSETCSYELNGHTFNINFIKWKDKIREKYYYYFLDESIIEKAKLLTSFNNNAIDFHHSVYIISDYFNDFMFSTDQIDNQINLIGKTEQDEIYKEVLKYLKDYLEKKRKDFVGIQAPKLIQSYEKEGVLPKFSKNKYDQERKKDLIEVMTEIYCVQPKIFIGLNKEQKKSFTGFLNLILDTDERENIISILDNVIKLTSKERENLCNVLKKTNLSRIIKTMKLIESRYSVIELLKKLVFDLGKYTTERYHIQKVVEENYWLFGEEYHLVSADKNFEHALMEYLYIIDENKEREKYKIENLQRLRRPDIFMCRKRNIEYFNNTELEENIIVELKDPKVIITKKEYRQVEDYLDIISKEPRFNSQTRKWKFIVVSNRIDENVKDLYKSFADKGKKFLVHQKDGYEIYAMTWDDIFRNFEIRHRYLYEKLDFDKNIIKEELELKGIALDRESSDEFRDKILAVTKI